MAFIPRGTALEDSSVLCLALIASHMETGAELLTFRDFNGRTVRAYPVLRANVTAITYKVFDVGPDKKGSTETASGILNPAATVQDTLQYGGWPKDGSGWNFAVTIPPAAFPNSDRFYWVEVLFTLNSGATVFHRWEVFIHKVATS